jgi:hypothetical protein
MLLFSQVVSLHLDEPLWLHQLSITYILTFFGFKTGRFSIDFAVEWITAVQAENKAIKFIDY